MNNRIKYDIDSVITELQKIKEQGFNNCYFGREVDENGKSQIMLVGVDRDDTVYSIHTVKSI